MMKLKVLGGLELSGDSVPEDGVRNLLAKPKLTAIVVRLMLAKPGSWCRRDTLAALFWPESDQAHARAALSQSLYQIRQHLGADVLEKRGNEDVRLAPGAITCDAVTVIEALDEGRLEDALAGYTGELLPAFHLPDDGAFSHWLDQERASLRERMVEAAWSAAEAAGPEGDLEAARSWYLMAAGLSPLDSDTIARAMAGLSRARDPKAALALFERHKSALKDELELEPDDTVVELAEKIYGRMADSKPTYRSTPQPEAKHLKATPRILLAPKRNLRITSAIIGAIAMLIVVFIVAPFTNRPAPLDPGLVAVMPFTYEGSHDEDRLLASAFTVGLVPLLDGTGGLRAIPQQLMSLTMEAQGLSWDSQLSPDEARTIAQAVGAGRYLSATVVSDGVHRHIAAALMDTESGEELQRVELEVDPLDVTAAIDRLVAQLLIPVAEQVRHAE